MANSEYIYRFGNRFGEANVYGRALSEARVGIVGAGPAGMAAALACLRAGLNVSVYERYPTVKPAGNILNLWPPPQKVLRLLGVDTNGLGAPATGSFRRSDGRVRANVKLPAHVVEEYGGGFIGLLRPGLYERMLAAIPEGVIHGGQELTHAVDTGDAVRLAFRGGLEAEVDVLVGADGINSAVRALLWGDAPPREQRLHLVGGYLFVDHVTDYVTVVAHNRTTQGSYSAIRDQGREGYEWWVLEAFDPLVPFERDLLDWSIERTRGFAEPLPSLIAQTPREHLFRWEIRDRKPIRQWSKGRITIIGDAAHPTSPYAAYGAGMSIEDGYFLAAELERADLHDSDDVRRALQAFEDRRKRYTAGMSQQAYYTGMMFHRLPAPLRPLRDFIYDHTPLLQKIVGDAMPSEISAQLDEIDLVERHRDENRAASSAVGE